MKTLRCSSSHPVVKVCDGGKTARAPAQTTIDDLRAGFRLQGLTSWKAIVVSSR
ncbi:hypothetical protein [Sorangium sp. So ce145]|uniref:hypothetical protein n=1 Tax=Sorangium sp. So ce145 TaxID=3133285 RepID=UPI003F5E77AA